MSSSHKGSLNVMYGKTHTPEARVKISEAHKGRKRSTEFREFTRRRRIGQKHSQETKEKIRAAHKGKKRTPEHCKHISESKIGKNAGAKSHRWRGGVSNLPYPFEFNSSLKNRIKRRDGFVCKMIGCGMSETGSKFNYGMPLTVHHIDYDKNNCADDNLITLCTGCNSRVNFNRDCWQDLFVRTLAFTPLVYLG